MIHIKDFYNEEAVFEALNSKVRRSILKILIDDGPNTLDTFAKRIGLTNGAITAHIKILEKSGLININLNTAVRGVSKVCSISTNRIIIDLLPAEKIIEKSREVEISVGQYSDYLVKPTCGLVTASEVIGRFDEPKYFAFAERKEAALIWFAGGHVEYIIPNILSEGETLTELQFMMEVASEAPGCVKYFPSDVFFYLNGIKLGFWTLLGENNDRRGLFTPDWWFENLGQYGQQKLLSITKNGTFVDGLKIGDVNIESLNIDSRSNIKFKLESPPDAVNAGGLSLFGKGFGDFNSGITCRIIYKE